MTKINYKLSCSQFLQVRLHVFYVINMYVKFRANWMLFIIRFTNLFFICNLYYKNMKFKHLVDGIAIDFLSSLNFASMKHIRRKYNSNLNFSKSISNKRILSEVVIQLSLLLNFVLSATLIAQLDGTSRCF